MTAALLGGEIACRVCGLRQSEAIWGTDGQCPTFAICACCGCEFGYEDISPDSIRSHRKEWLARGAEWFSRKEQPASWTVEAQLSQVPGFYPTGS